jgi:predicted peroxiredoxin
MEEIPAMSKYLLIESRDPFDSRDALRYAELAAGLAGAGHAVTLFLVQNGVLTARKGAQTEALAGALKAGVEVLADEFSLRERGIARDRLAQGVKPALLEVVIDQLAEGRKALWH